MTNIEYNNPIFVSEDGSAITCQITLPSGAVIPFTARSDDPEEHGRAIHAAILGNVHEVPVAAFVSEPKPEPLSETGAPPEQIA
jgi:hypothetical protein